MAPTPLFEAIHAAQSLASAEYRGVETAARFSDPAREFAALTGGCGVYDLGFRARFSLAGQDRVRWLNGMVTNNVRDLAPGFGVYAFLLNPQGHILGDLCAFNRGEDLVIATDRGQLEKIRATFDHYIIMDDVTVGDLDGGKTTLGISGPQSQKILKAAGIDVPELKPLQLFIARCECDCGCVNCTIVRGDDPEQESYEIWLDATEAAKTFQALIAHGATPVGSEAIEIHRIASGIPLYGVDIRERDLPQETEQARALNFNKGCYVGQEIVERIRSRGNVHRKFTGFLLEGSPSITAGAKILSGEGSNEKQVGEITSAAALPGTPRRTVALGYIRREVAIPGREVTIDSEPAKVISLPIHDIKPAAAEDAVLHKA